jgi:outer membrane lipoprotein carrier protein
MMRSLFFLLGLFFLTALHAQKSPIVESSDARAVGFLDKMKTKFSGYKTLQANFKLTIKLENQSEVQQGIMYVSGDKFRVEIHGQHIISDGKTVWYHDMTNNQLQINNVDDNVMSPASLLKIYEQGGKVICGYMGEETVNGKTTNEIEMKPKDRNADYGKISVFLDKANDQIVQAIVFGKDGMKYTFDVERIVPNVVVGNDRFFFDQSKFTGEVIDLR